MTVNTIYKGMVNTMSPPWRCIDCPHHDGGCWVKFLLECGESRERDGQGRGRKGRKDLVSDNTRRGKGRVTSYLVTRTYGGRGHSRIANIPSYWSRDMPGTILPNNLGIWNCDKIRIWNCITLGIWNLELSFVRRAFFVQSFVRGALFA